MSEGFRDCFVGENGYNAVRRTMKAGNEFCTEVAKCIHERNQAEIAYVRELRKIGGTFAKLAEKARGTLAEAFDNLAIQTKNEADAHNFVADKLLNDIYIPLKDLAESQAKERKSTEEILNGKLKEWNSKKVTENGYRSRQFSKCREIETLAAKISEASNGSKSSSRSKTGSGSAPLVMGCVLPVSRYSSASEKLDATIKKAEEDLERIDEKYHLATRNVELLRQYFDAELYRSCDQLQKMEINRLTEMSTYMATYAASFETLTQTMSQITINLFAAKIIPENDILVQVKSYNQPAEIEVLLYDIYAENENNSMSEQRRILNLISWMERLKRDIKIQEQTKTDIVCNSIRFDNDSSSSNDDDDGGMHHEKKGEKMKSKVSNRSVSSEVFVDRQGAAILEELNRASLYKIECTYNRIKKKSEPHYRYADKITRTFLKDGIPTTLLRLPCQPPMQTPASAPTAMQYFAESMPMFQAPVKRVSPSKKEPPSVGWNTPQCQSAQAQAMNAMYPVLLARAPPPTPNEHVRVLYEYIAKHDDELDLQPGDIIVLMERRDDGWCKGNLKGKVGLFPGNFATDL